MNQSSFLNDYRFRFYTFDRDHFNDRSKTPIPVHYFGQLVSGTGLIKTQGSELLLQPGDIFYFPKWLQYRSQWYCKGGGNVSFYSFGFKYLPTDKSFPLQKLNCSERGRGLFSELCEAAAVTEKSVGLLYAFFGQEAENMQKDRQERWNLHLEKALSRLEENPHLKASELAKLCSVSESGLYLLFQKHLRKTPNAVRREMLCKKAAALLSSTDKSVEEISDLLGFSSASYFRVILKKQLGKTPREIRKEAAF